MPAKTTIQVKLSVITKGERKHFYDKNRWKEFMFTKPAVKRILEEILQSEERIKHTQGGTYVIPEELINTSLRKHYSQTK